MPPRRHQSSLSPTRSAPPRLLSSRSADRSVPQFKSARHTDGRSFVASRDDARRATTTTTRREWTTSTPAPRAAVVVATIQFDSISARSLDSGAKFHRLVNFPNTNT
jgi:hypothetical protein